MTELFLVLITILAALVGSDDRAPALIYCLVAHMFNFIAGMTNNDAQIFMIGAVSDVLVIALLVCLNGCLRSKITFFLIPLSVLSIVMHFWGWTIYHSNDSYGAFNSVVAFYLCVIVALFVSRIAINGDTTGHSRFLRRNHRGAKNVGVVSE